MKQSRLGSLTLLCLAIALMLGGCATTQEVEQLRTEVQTASANASSANEKADAALKEATAAREAAERAEQAAMDAKAAAEATDAKIDNMFKKSMQKG
ncbi:MAG TPA: Lpp/OprI family alanine-zipper lipoprotein [Xanthomonadales bacterium]|nr:Lpp/OprI family alanine-zipper lipoprotein [Xanthomonadales bacterium]